MPSTSSSNTSFSAFKRSILGLGSDHSNNHSQNQVHSEEVSNEGKLILDRELEVFQELVVDRLNLLLESGSDEFLSIEWMLKLLDVFVVCQEKFKVILVNNADSVVKSPIDRMVTEFFDRSVKALDICNATRDGIEKVRLWRKHLEIVVSALDSSKQRNVIGEGQFRRARKTFTDLAIVMLDDQKDSGSVFSHRNRSFGRPNKVKELSTQRKQGHSRSLSWSVSNNWSASKQLQSMAGSLVPPRMNEISNHNGLANCVFTMGFVLMFVLWTIVAAIPCQDRGLFNLSVPRQFSWSTPMFMLHTRILDESKKRERKNSPGLLREIHQMEKSINLVSDLIDSVQQFPLTEEQQKEVKDGVQELALVCNSCKSGLDTLDRQLREVFRQIMYCRTEGLETLNRAQS